MGHLRHDTHWSTYTDEPAYRALLTATARVFVALVAARVGRDDLATAEAYGRAVGALCQLPMEYGNAGARFDRSTWRLTDVDPSQPPPKLHCEHPWVKHLTKLLIRHGTEHALKAGVEHVTIEAQVAEILDARQATVVLRHQKTAEAHIRSGKEDGLSRYRAPIATERLIDRASGTPVTLDQMRTIDLTSRARVDAALARLGYPGTLETVHARWKNERPARRRG